MSVYKKIAAVMAEIGTLPKDAKHDQGYAYQSIQAVSARINSVMSKNGLVCLPSVSGWQMVDGRYIVEYDMMLVDADTGDSVHRSWASEAMSVIKRRDGSELPDDKALGKAHSYAMKYFLIRTFIVSAQDDVDGDETDHAPRPPRQTTPASSVTSGNAQFKPNPFAAVMKNPSATAMDDHFEPGDFMTPPAPAQDVEVFSDPIERVTIKKTGKGQVFYVIAGCSIFKTDVFEELGFDSYTVDQLSRVGTVLLPDPVRIAYLPADNVRKYNEALRMFRPMTNQKVIIKESA